MRYTDDQRAALFESGLTACGYQPVHDLPQNPAKNDIFVTWNRIGAGNNVAKVFEERGLPVLVVENASWGNAFAGEQWYHIARTYHNTAGCFPVGDATRWDALGVELAEWRQRGETVILPQRGIGSDPVRMPANFTRKALMRFGGRLRFHPGKRADGLPLEKDLRNCGQVITWGSGGAIKALMLGIPVISYMPNWIGEQDNTNASRLAMFRRLAWAQWRHSEIASGEVFARLLAPDIE